MSNPVWIVTAYRFGDRERHSYVVGAYSDDFIALVCADNEEELRGGKYVCEIIGVEMDNYSDDDPIILKRLPAPVPKTYTAQIDGITGTLSTIMNDGTVTVSMNQNAVDLNHNGVDQLLHNLHHIYRSIK